MIYFGLSTTVLLGICVALSISQRLKLPEVVGLAFPVGIGLQTFLMILLDVLNIRITATSVLTGSWLAIAAAATFFYLRRDLLRGWWRYAGRLTRPKISWLWLLSLLATGVVLVMIFDKTMFFPTFDTDSVRGFNLVGKVVAHEGTLKNCSLFTDPNHWEMHGPGSYMTYTPLLQLAYAYVYMLGAATSKIVSALLYVSLAVAFYGVTSRFATHTLTALATFFTVFTPEMLAFSAMSGTNVPHAVYASLGILFFVAWYYKKIPSLLWVSAALLICNSWTRSEGVAFAGAACCVMLWYSIRTKTYRKPFLFAALCLFPTVFWQLFLKLYNMEGVVTFVRSWDSHRVAVEVTEIWQLFKSFTYYGFTFLCFLIALLSNVWAMVKKRDHLATLALIFLACLFYSVLIYLVDYTWDSLEAVLRSSYKRFLFSFVPLLWFYTAAGYNMRWLFGKVDDFLYPLDRKNTKKKR
ncbi:MAG: hypothetical protein LBG47_07400 [Prevotellaceae bacterium]|jgi:hypothetical protein|nr:hypothetical protein [Prevotellaceae bacterium]